MLLYLTSQSERERRVKDKRNIFFLFFGAMGSILCSAAAAPLFFFALEKSHEVKYSPLSANVQAYCKKGEGGGMPEVIA